MRKGIYLTICFLLGMMVPTISTFATAVPYDLQKFKPVLDASKLQAPGTTQLIGVGQFQGQSNQYFYLDSSNQYMAFFASGEGNRSELRQEIGDDWDTATTDRLSLDARVRLAAPQAQTPDEYTFMQVHASDSLGVPLLRLTWERDRSNMQDQLWARIRMPADLNEPIAPDNLATATVNLGSRPTDFFNASVVVHDSQLRVLIDGQVKLDMDVSYWDGKDSYFKAGVYLQDPGSVEVQFDQLSYGVNVPEPASGLLLALPGVVLLSSRHQNRRHTANPASIDKMHPDLITSDAPICFRKSVAND